MLLFSSWLYYYYCIVSVCELSQMSVVCGQVVANNRQLHNSVLTIINEFTHQRPGNINRFVCVDNSGHVIPLHICR